MKRLRIAPYVFIIIAAILWSFDGILRRSLFTLPSSVIVFWEHVMGAIILTPFSIKYVGQLKKLTSRDWVALILVSLFSGALGTILYTSALAKVNYIQFSVVVLLQQLQPVWAIVTAAIVLRESVPKSFIKWAGLAISASFFVTFRDLRVNLATDSSTLSAALMAIMAGVMWGSSTSFSKIVLNKVAYALATYLRFIFASVIALVIIIFLNQSKQLTGMQPDQWRTLLIITMSTGMVALVIYYYGLRKTQAKISAVCELIWPVSAIFIDYFYFKNTLSLSQLLAVPVVLLSIYKISTFKQSAKQYQVVVLNGEKQGRTIGYPTLNLDPLILPCKLQKGVYSTRVTYNGNIYKGVLYYGPRLVKGEVHNVLEIYVLDFDKEIYGETIGFTVGSFIRPPLSFKSMDEMKYQIQKDVMEVQKSG